MSAGSLSTLRKRNRVNPMAGMTAAEKNAYLTAKTLAIRGPVHNYAPVTDKAAEAAKTARLVGRRNESRSQ